MFLVNKKVLSVALSVIVDNQLHLLILSTIPPNNAMQGPWAAHTNLHKFYIIQAIYAHCSHFKTIKKVN